MGMDRYLEEQEGRLYGNNDLDRLIKVFDRIEVPYVVFEHKDHYEVRVAGVKFIFSPEKKKFKNNAN